MRYSIVIPCYNESENILDLVKVIKKIPKKYSVEFVLVENGSTDDSRDVFESLTVDPKRIKRVYVDHNQGYGYGIIQGLKASCGKYVGWLHADLQYNPLDLLPFFDYIEKHPGKMLLKGKRKNRKFIEHIFTYGMGLYDSLIFKKKMREVMSMPVIFNRDLLQDIESFPIDFSIDIYIYALALKKDYTVIHLPICLKNREKGKSSWNTGFVSRIKQSRKMMVASKKVKKDLESRD